MRVHLSFSFFIFLEVFVLTFSKTDNLDSFLHYQNPSMFGDENNPCPIP